MCLALVFQEIHQGSGRLQGGLVAIEINPIHTLNIERDMIAQQFKYGRPGRFLPSSGYSLCPLMPNH